MNLPAQRVAVSRRTCGQNRLHRWLGGHPVTPHAHAARQLAARPSFAREISAAHEIGMLAAGRICFAIMPLEARTKRLTRCFASRISVKNPVAFRTNPFFDGIRPCAAGFFIQTRKRFCCGRPPPATPAANGQANGGLWLFTGCGPHYGRTWRLLNRAAPLLSR